MKRCLVISDSFKGTLSSPDICRIARSISLPGWHIDALNYRAALTALLEEY